MDETTHSLPPDIRIGCVPYLNAKPLIHGIETRCDLRHPAALADAFRDNQLDVALLPVAEWFQLPGCPTVEGIGIACDGPVHSVILAGIDSPRPLDTVFLDEASRTSALLTRLLLQDHPPARYLPVPPDQTDALALQPNQAALLIGSQAIRFRAAHPNTPVLDLGAEWKRRTGLPFVFALWVMRPDLPHRNHVAAALRSAAARGIRWAESLPPNSFEHHYLTHNIHFLIRSPEKTALARFQKGVSQQFLTE